VPLKEYCSGSPIDGEPATAHGTRIGTGRRNKRGDLS